MQRKRIIGFIAVVSLLAVGWTFFQNKKASFLPIQRVSIQGEYRYLDTEELKKAVNEQVRNGFLWVSVNKLRQSLERLPWIESVAIKRVGHDGLEISVKERAVIGKWEEDALLVEGGKILKTTLLKKAPAGLPVFRGSPNQAQVISESYHPLQASLDRLQMQIVELHVTGRGAWEIVLNNGLKVVLGKVEVERRLEKFISLYTLFSEADRAQIEKVDLRYANGIAVKRKV